MKKIYKMIMSTIFICAILTVAFKFEVTNISVDGNRIVDADYIKTKVVKNNFLKKSIVLFLCDNLLGHEKISYIDDYTINWLTPFHINISVNEKKNVGYIKKDIKNMYFDNDCMVTEISENRDEGLPEISGVNLRYNANNKIEFENEELTKMIMKIIYKLNGKIKLNQINVDKNKNITLYLSDIIVELGETNNIDFKIDRLIKMYDKISDKKGILDLKKAGEKITNERYVFKTNEIK